MQEDHLGQVEHESGVFAIRCPLHEFKNQATDVLHGEEYAVIRTLDQRTTGYQIPNTRQRGVISISAGTNVV